MQRWSAIVVGASLVVACRHAADHQTNPDGTLAVDAIDAVDAPACPAQLGERFVCDTAGANRSRCVDGKLEQVACMYGCVDGTGGDDATCACGSDAALVRWNCEPDGDLHSCAGGLSLIAESCGGRGCTVQPNGISDTCNGTANNALQAVLDQLGPLCGQYSPGTTCGLAVRDLATGLQAHYRGNAFYVSASSAKAIWVAAALYDTSIDAVMPYAGPVFTYSDNTAAGQVIDLLASPDRVNTFMWNDGELPDSGFCHWNYDKARDATNCPQVMGGDNFFTADDMMRFTSELWDRSLLDDARASAELGWMQLSPRSGYGGWLGTQLPAAAQTTMHHKAGWLPPNEVPGYSNSNEIGIVEVPSGDAYAVAILMDGGSDYDNKQLPMMEFASCVIFHAVARDAADPFAACTHP